MKKQLLHILKNCIGLLAFSMSSTHASELVVNANDSWSVDGGVFHPSDRPIPEEAQTIIVKDQDGNLRLFESKESSHQTNSDRQNLNTINVDKTAPQINTKWKQVSINQSGIKIGPNSELHITIEDGELHELDTNGVTTSNGETIIVEAFNEKSNEITIKAVDEFNNKSEKVLSFISDFDAPVVDWELNAPAINNQGVWFAAKNADLSLRIHDESEIALVLHNNKEVMNIDVDFNVSQGDVIQVLDKLGNQATVEVDWQQDNDPPRLSIFGGGAELIDSKKIYVKINHVFELTAQDDGVGLKSQIYKGLVSKWQPLPKKFRFTHKGNYRIKVKLEDLVGNVVEKNLQVKVKR